MDKWTNVKTEDVVFEQVNLQNNITVKYLRSHTLHNTDQHKVTSTKTPTTLQHSTALVDIVSGLARVEVQLGNSQQSVEMPQTVYLLLWWTLTPRRQVQQTSGEDPAELLLLSSSSSSSFNYCRSHSNHSTSQVKTMLRFSLDNLTTIKICKAQLYQTITNKQLYIAR